MPLIRNEKYKVFFDKWLEYQPLTLNEFTNALDKIQYKDSHRTRQVKYFFTIAFYTGLRPEEIVTLTPINFTKIPRKAITIKLTALKKGVSGTVALPLNEYTAPIFDYVSKLPPGLRIFWTLYKDTPNKVTFLVKKEGPDGKKVLTKTTKVYTRHSGRIDAISKKWFGFPCYYFRHNRFSHARKLGATRDDILELKLGKDFRSVDAYLKFGSTDAVKKLKFIPKN
jgi:integrase